MTPERFQRAKQLFADLCERPPHERRARLRAACGDDAELQAQVESLLQIDTQRPDFLSAPAFSGTRLREVAEQSSQDVQNACVLPALSIRGFRLLRVIGEGGMGVVYEAEQEHPRRTVALKIIRPGLMSHRILRRFQQEADILGQLQHPGIAQIYEAGMAEIEGSGFRVQGSDTSADARVPFFAMEFVRGQPLIDYATQHELGTRQRLELIAKVCDAVQHAHQHSVIHRDLKPANILVVDDSEPLTPVGGDTRALKACTSRPAFAGGILSSPTPIGSDVAARATPRPRGRGSECIIESAIPKILDFGVARLTDSDVQVTTVQTDVGQLIGTIPYMSPEQIVGDPQQVDARADIYALGVILYELLSGRLPLDVRHRSIPEAARMIREEEPSRLSSINAMFRGDIETIVAKALEKEPQRRYASASELGADIRRYLADQPIAARPASTLYQLRKFAKRNRALVGGVASTLLVLMAGAVA
ncbi:MAG TPA: serine/threonine-protein kinase, partial [Phycisphaerae bacterium]